jgi:hypothetical protein
VAGLVAVADEGERELALRVILLPQQLHAERAGVEGERFLEVVHAQHRVQHARAGGRRRGGGRRHAFLLCRSGVAPVRFN